MAAERFDIEVRDLVAKTIRAELKAIGTEARSTHGIVQQMNRELAAGSRTAAAGAQTAATAAAQAASRSAAAQAKATAESARAAAQAARTETAQRKANVAYLQEEAALNRAVAAEARAIASKQRLAAASNQAASATERQIRITTGSVTQGSGAMFGASVGSRALASRQTEIMRGMGGGGGGLAEPAAAAATITNLERVAVASVGAGKGLQSVGQMSNNARIAMLDMTHVGINMGQMLASGVNPMRALVMESGRIATAVQYSGGSIRKLMSDTAGWIGLTKKVSDATKDAAAAQAMATMLNIASVDAQALASVAAAETEIALARAQQQAATTAAEAAAASARLAAANEALSIANGEAAISSRALAAAQGQSAEATTAANGATTRSLTSLGRGGLYGAAALAVLVATLGVLKSEANDDSGLKHYTKSMGYTAAEVKKLNAVTVSWGDTAKAVFQVGARNVASAFGISTASIRNAWSNALSWMATVTRATMAGIYAAFAGMAYGVKNIINNIRDPKVDSRNPLKNLVSGYKEAYGDAQGFFDDVIKQARANARAGQDAMASEMYDAPHQKKPKTGGWDRAKELRDANAELDVQIGMLGKYGDALERAQQIEQIGRQFREHNAPLTAAETQVLSDKIQKLQEGKRVQEAMTAAEEAANGPARKFADTQAALNKLYADGVISAEDYTNQLNLASRAYIDALDPLAALNRELDKQGKLMSLYGRSKDVATYIQQLQEAAEARGGSIYKRHTGPANDNGDITVYGNSRTLTDDAQSMVDQFKKQQRTGELTSRFEEIDPREKKRQESTTNFILDNYREMYAAIDEFRQQDVANEEEAAERKKNLDTALGQARLQTASDIFGMLATLQGSHNKTVAAIGKAAAITQATIDGIVAVQAALKGPPGPPWSFAIAGATAVMTAVNVAKIAGIGFQRGGYTGDGNPGDQAGPAHRQEFIFDAAATRRIGVPALEAMRSGARLNGPSGPSNDNRSRGVTVHQYPGVAVEVRERSDGEIEVIAERAARRVAPGAVAADMQNPNSRTSKAFQTNFGARRQR